MDRSIMAHRLCYSDQITKVCAGSATLLAVTAGRRATTLRARTSALTRFLGCVKADRGMTFPHDLACFVEFFKNFGRFVLHEVDSDRHESSYGFP